MDARDQTRLVDALTYALERHGAQTRKAKGRVPYASHLLQVCGLVLEYGEGDVELAQAALLHDVIEDTEATPPEVRSTFGDRVADIVEACTDLLPGDTAEAKGPWLERKEGYIERLRGKPYGARLVSACDKLHNLTNIVADLRVRGPVFLQEFTAPEGVPWYYRELRTALGDDLPEPLRSSFDALLEEFAALLGDSPWSPPPTPS